LGLGERVNCTQVLELGGIDIVETSIAGPVLGAVGVVLLVVAVIATVAGARIKSELD